LAASTSLTGCRSLPGSVFDAQRFDAQSKDLRRTLVGPTVRLYYDTVVAIALMAVFAIVCGFVAAVITGGSPPNFTIAGIAFLLAGAVWFFRLWFNSQASGHPPA